MFFLRLSLFLMLTPLLADIDPKWKKRVEQIDEEMGLLENRKNRAEAAARRYQDQGDRWQFYPGRFDDARDAWEQADKKWYTVERLQRQIEQLKEKKSDILEEHAE